MELIVQSNANDVVAETCCRGGNVRGNSPANIAKRVARINKATTLVAFFFPVASLFVATQYEIPFKLSISTFHVSVMAITPATAIHKVRHPSR